MGVAPGRLGKSSSKLGPLELVVVAQEACTFLPEEMASFLAKLLSGTPDPFELAPIPEAAPPLKLGKS